MSNRRAFSFRLLIGPATACFSASSVALFTGLALTYFDLQTMAERRLALAGPRPDPVPVEVLAEAGDGLRLHEALVLARPTRQRGIHDTGAGQRAYPLGQTLSGPASPDRGLPGVALLPADGADRLHATLAEAALTGDTITLHGQVGDASSLGETMRAALRQAGLVPRPNTVVVRPFALPRDIALTQPVRHPWRTPAFWAFALFAVLGLILHRNRTGHHHLAEFQDDTSAARLQRRARHARPRSSKVRGRFEPLAAEHDPAQGRAEPTKARPGPFSRLSARVCAWMAPRVPFVRRDGR